MQVCPPLRSFPKTMSATVWSCTCPLATMAGDLPPSSSVTGTRFAGRLHDGSSDGGASGEEVADEGQGLLAARHPAHDLDDLPPREQLGGEGERTAVGDHRGRCGTAVQGCEGCL